MRRILMILTFLGCADVAFAQKSVNFESEIRPVFLKYCGECHGPEVQKSGLRLDARHAAFRGGDGGPVIRPGESATSELVRRLTTSVAEERMPPEGNPVPSAEIARIITWINEGAEWPETDYDRQAAKDPRLEHWAFQPLNPVTVPEVDPSWNMPSTPNEIDRFILPQLHRQALSMNPEADRLTLIRRLSLIMTGLPPTPQQIKEFKMDDQPDAWSRLVEKQLASHHYGERWAQHWLDVVRYADTHGFEVNTPRENAWPYRDYVIRAFNEDKPYDKFIREQLVGDLYQCDEATGFMVASAVLLPGQIGADDVSKRLARQDALDEIIVGTSSTLLGLTIGCARCHDHKFDPITSRDYYSLQAFFAGVEYGDRPVRDARFSEKQKQAADVGLNIAQLESSLSALEPLATPGRTLLLDEADSTVVTYLKQENGPGQNPSGTKPGYQGELGSANRLSNISGGRYTWWNNVPGEDVMTYHPRVAGHFNLWLSWGAHGSGVHTRDARYVLDIDGNLSTLDDQKEVARVDQYYLAGVRDCETEKVPLWSGLQHAGLVNLQPSSCLILRGGETGTGITADVIVLQEATETAATGPADRGSSTKTVLPTLRAPVNAARNVEHFAAQSVKFVRFTSLATTNDNQHEPCLDELEVYATANPDQNLALNAGRTSSGNISETGIHQLAHINDGLYGNDHSWISSQRGGGWVQLELPEVTTIHRLVWGRDRNGTFLDRLPVRYEIATSIDGKVWTVVARSDDRPPMGTPFDPVLSLLANASQDLPSDLPAVLVKLEELRQEKARLETPSMVFGGTFRQPDSTHVLRRGDPEQPMDPTMPEIPGVFHAVRKKDEGAANSQTVSPENGNNEQERRRILADWIASPENPMTARVMVNRIWLYHFGRGLVDTPSDFGVNGSLPSHPELLDWLATEFIRSGWSVKHIQRLILNSATWKQSNTINAAFAAIDRDNTLLWRFTSRRMESESIRDTLLFVSGELNTKMGGPGFNFFKSRGGLDGFPPLDVFGPDEMRRMIYSHKVRMEQVPVFGAFDCPDAGQSMPRRGRSTTPIQALNLFNSPFVVDRVATFAERVEQSAPQNIEQQTTTAYEMALGRRPSESEFSASVTVVREHGLPVLCRVLFNSNEFLFIP